MYAIGLLEKRLPEIKAYSDDRRVVERRPFSRQKMELSERPNRRILLKNIRKGDFKSLVLLIIAFLPTHRKEILRKLS